jgi:hypothetical protein
MEHKTKTRGFDEAECCYNKALSANPRKIGPKCRKPRLKASPSSQLIDSIARTREERIRVYLCLGSLLLKKWLKKSLSMGT